VDTVAGIGPKTAAALAAVGVRRVADLLLHLPRRYEDRGEVVTVADALRTGGQVLLRGRVTATAGRRVRRRLHIADGTVVDGSGGLAVRWFNQPWVAERYAGDGLEAWVYGTVGRSRQGRLQLVNPELQPVEAGQRRDEVVPVYPRLGPLTGRRLRNVMVRALEALELLEDPLPEELRDELGLPDLATALAALHRPGAPADRHDRRKRVAALNDRESPEHRRLAFDELLALAAVVADLRARRREQAAEPIPVRGSFADTCRTLLPFELTAAQRRVVGEVLADLGRPGRWRGCSRGTSGGQDGGGRAGDPGRPRKRAPGRTDGPHRAPRRAALPHRGGLLGGRHRIALLTASLPAAEADCGPGRPGRRGPSGWRWAPTPCSRSR
jgi:ATP-dependent DNA helicase RecG